MTKGTVVTIGTFDGVHLGHQAILSEVRRQAVRKGVASVAYAFGLPPRLQVDTTLRRALLLPEPIKVRLLLRTVDRVVPAPFSDIRALSPQQFAKTILADGLRAESVVVGSSFRFGAGRSGDPRTLRTLGERHGFSVTVVAEVTVDGEPVTSTRIRRLLRDGDVPRATALLGRSPVLIGDVIRGDRVGRALGYPTANLAIDQTVLLPRHGVYVARSFLGDRPDPAAQPALLYVGTRPTLGVAEGGLRCEVHLLAPPAGDLCGAPMEVHVLVRLRDDRQFASLDDLRRQIAQDVDRATAILARIPAPSPPIGG